MKFVRVSGNEIQVKIGRPVVMAAILDLCKLGIRKGFYAEINVISVF